MAHSTLRLLGPDEFVKRTIALLGSVPVYPAIGRVPGPRKIIGYRTFVTLVSKYVSQAPHIDATWKDSARGIGFWDIFFSCSPPRALVMHKRPAFPLSLNDAVTLGVQPEYVTVFRRRFGLTGGDDEFFQIPQCVL